MENENPDIFDVSIVIVNWNTRQLTCDCIKSILEKTENIPLEIIVVDNASSDGSIEVISRDFPTVKLIVNEENLGFAKANNIGISQSSGKYLYLINSDIIIIEDCISNMLSFMDNHPSAGMSGPKILNHDHTLQPNCRHYPGLWNKFCQAIGLSRMFSNSALFSEPFMNYWKHDTVRKVDVLTGCFWVVRRKALDEVGLLDEKFFFYGEDIDWCKRFKIAGWDILFNPDAQAIHLGGASSSIAPLKFHLEMQKADLQYWKKHHNRIAVVCYLLIVIVRHAVRIIPFLILFLLKTASRKTSLLKLKRSLATIRWGCEQVFISLQH